MKQYLVRALEWAIAISLGMILVDIYQKNEIRFDTIALRFVIAMIIDILFSVIGEKIKNSKQNRK